MKNNVGGIDKILRIVAGLGLIAWAAVGNGPAWAWIGVMPLATGLLGTSQGSPYWGDYAMGAPFWLSADQTLLFTSAGSYFRTSDLTYAGTLEVLP